MLERTEIPSNRLWSGAAYSRAVRVGGIIEVSGTTASGPSGEVLAEGDMYEQTRIVLQRIVDAVVELGGKPSDIVRTRVFTPAIDRWQEIGRAHAEFFADYPPASAFYGVKDLLLPGLLVEIEAMAIVRDA